MIVKRGLPAKFMLPSLSRKGMSPLIATVLLIAFAVALGAMVINLGSDFGGGPDCSKVNIKVPTICYAENLIKLTIMNQGDPVESITLKASDDKTNTQIELKNTKLASNHDIMVEAPFIKTSKTYVELVASVMQGKKPTLCTKPAIVIDDLPDCTA